VPAIEPGTCRESMWAQAAELSGLSEIELVKQAAEHFQVGLADLNQFETQVIRLVPEKVARTYHVFPLHQDDRQLVIATSDPGDIEAEETLRFVSGRRVVFELAPPSGLRRAIEANYQPDMAIETLLNNIGGDPAVYSSLETETDAVTGGEVAEGPLVKLTNLILGEALEAHASDVHLEPGRGAGVVRFRVDGELRLHSQLPMPVLHRLTSRIKVMGNLDITERMLPQDGRSRIRVKNQFHDIRISTVPARGGEKIVMRITYPDKSGKIKDLGFEAAEVDRLGQMLSRRDGIVFVTGPTGSGKTTTLYAVLRELMGEKVNVMTVEEPVEYELEGITQIQIEPQRGVTFATALRAMLRQDPDIILVGEVRDLETAQIAVQASQTGHLVLATLHTNNALGVFPRLHDLGLSRRALSESVRGIVFQQLVRRVCPNCAVQVNGELSEEETRLVGLYGVVPTIRAKGCGQCAQTGYRGRKPAVESVIVTPELENLIAQGAASSVLREEAIRGGMQPIRQGALELVGEGVTTLEEIERVFGDSPDQSPSQSQNEPRVLMVDDDPVIRKIARSVLEKAGFRCSEAGDGAEALECLNAHEDYDLMILDVNMPGMGGKEVLQHVRSSVRTAGLPVIVLTASATLELEVQLIELGADDYIRKPLEPSRFVARVKAVLRRAGS